MALGHFCLSEFTLQKDMPIWNRGAVDKKDGQWRYESNIGRRSRSNCCHGKAMCVTYFECVSVALGILHTKRMGRIVLSSVACLDLHYPSTLSFYIILLHYPSTLSFYIILLHYLSTLSFYIILLHYPSTLSFYIILLHYLINNTIWGNKDIKYKTFVLIFFTTFVCNISRSWKNWAMYWS